MKNKNSQHLSKIIYGLSFFVFLVISLWGMFFLDPGDEMGYVILNFYIIMPLTSFIMGIILTVKNETLKWEYPVIFGLFGVIIPIAVFNGSWDWISLFFSLIPGFIGLFIGLLINKFRINKDEYIKE